MNESVLRQSDLHALAEDIMAQVQGAIDAWLDRISDQ